MTKKTLPAVLFALAAAPVWAQPVPALQEMPDSAAVAAPPVSGGILGSNPTLDAKEKQALALSQKWIHGTAKPITAGDGAVTYFFGKSLPVLVCAPMKVCDLQLQAGERITKNGVNRGDSRWEVTPALSGEGDDQQTHLLLKPSDVGLDTNLVVNTNRRTYTIKLLSREKDWMPTVNFDYPETLKSAWDDYYSAQRQETAQKTLGNGLNIDNLDFDYKVEGKADFKPVRVYSNGIKTFIEMPRSVSSNELPAVLVVNAGTGEKEIVNYGFKDGRFIVDQLAKQLILVQGVGRQQQSVLVTRGK